MSLMRPRSAVAALVIVTLVTSLAAAVACGGRALADDDDGGLPGPLYCTRVYLNGRRVLLPVPAVMSNGSTLVPVRAVCEALGADVHWDGTGGVRISRDGRTIDLRVRVNWAVVDGVTRDLAAAPVLWRSTVMVPARFVAECMGLTVSWDQGRRAVLLSSEAAPGGATTGNSINEITLAFAGDVLIGYQIGDLIAARGADWPWGGVSDVFKAADITMVNLECCVSRRGSPMPNKQWTFRAAPESLAGVVNAGVDVVSVANNHVLDFGQDAFLDTLAYLDQYGIKRVGGGANLDEARRPVIIEAGGLKVGFLAATAIYPVNEWVATNSRPGVLPTHYESIVMQAVSDLSRQSDYVVVSVHWGVEREHNANAYQQNYARALVNAGADIVVGHHPHVLEGMEVYKGSLIAYSLGNFVFTTATRAGQDSGILLVTLDDQGIAAAQLVPVFTDHGRPELETGDDHDRILTSLNGWSERWGTVFDPKGYILLP